MLRILNSVTVFVSAEFRDTLMGTNRNPLAAL